MERHDLLEAMGDLKLHGMRASFDEITGKGLSRRDELYPLLASLLRAEQNHRQARSIVYRISSAKFPVLKDLSAFRFTETPVDEDKGRSIPIVGVSDDTHLTLAYAAPADTHQRSQRLARTISEQGGDRL